ncbi:MAG TPA: AraC family ligand binding domain-containing protein [Armatimonadota bacterium]
MMHATPIQRLRRHAYFRDGFPLAVSYTTGVTDYPLHSHDFSEFVFVQRGEGVHLVAGQAHPIRGGDVFAIHGTLAHGFRDMRGMDHINVLFTPEALHLTGHARGTLAGYHALFAVEPLASSRQTFNCRLHLTPGQQVWLQATIEHLDHELHTRTPGFEDMAFAYFQQIVVFISRAYSQQRSDTSDRVLRLGKLISLLEQDYAAPGRQPNWRSVSV